MTRSERTSTAWKDELASCSDPAWLEELARQNQDFLGLKNLTRWDVKDVVKYPGVGPASTPTRQVTSWVVHVTDGKKVSYKGIRLYAYASEGGAWLVSSLELLQVNEG